MCSYRGLFNKRWPIRSSSMLASPRIVRILRSAHDLPDYNRAIGCRSLHPPAWPRRPEPLGGARSIPDTCCRSESPGPARCLAALRCDHARNDQHQCGHTGGHPETYASGLLGCGVCRLTRKKRRESLIADRATAYDRRFDRLLPADLRRTAAAGLQLPSAGAPPITPCRRSRYLRPR
jgi:hypothetical protein